MKNTKMLALIIMLVALAAGVLYFWDMLKQFVVAALMAYLLSPLTQYIIDKAALKKGVAVTIVLFLFVFILMFVISISAPAVVTQLTNLLTEIRRYASNIDELLASAQSYMEKLHLPEPVMETIMDMISQGDSYILSFIGSLVSSLAKLSMQVFDLIILIILLIYFMLDGDKLVNAAVSAFPPKAATKVAAILVEADELTWKYLRSRCVVSGGMAVVTYIGLRIMGIRYALLFALISFFLDFIPYFGSFIAGAVEAFYALITGGVSLAVTVVIFVLVVQQIEGNIVGPKLQGDAAGVHPITVMFALLACNKIWGTFGMLISTPVAALIKLIVKELYAFVISPDEPDAPHVSDLLEPVTENPDHGRDIGNATE